MDEVSGDSRFASIDVGSHTIRLLIVAVGPNREVLPLQVDRRITRLARNFSEDEILKEPGIVESIAVLTEFALLVHCHQVRSVACGATGVVRRARNSAEFLQRIQEATGLRPEILSEEAEAFLSAKGVLGGLPRAERLVLSFDLGGSSTELVLIDTSQGESLWSTSMAIGAATITEQWLPGDPPEGPSFTRAREAIRDVLERTLPALRVVLRDLNIPSQALQLVGTAGTVTTLAAMLLEMDFYQPSRVNGLILSEEWLARLIDRLAKLSLAQRRELAGLEKGREGIILGGALIVHELMNGLEQAHLTVVDSGLLEGLVLSLIEKEYGWPSKLSSPLTMRLQER